MRLTARTIAGQRHVSQSPTSLSVPLWVTGQGRCWCHKAGSGAEVVARGLSEHLLARAL